MRLGKLLLAHSISRCLSFLSPKPVRALVYYQSLFTMLEREAQAEMMCFLPAQADEQLPAPTLH